MTTLPNTIPCSKLAEPALVARVSSCMDTGGMARPPYELRAGFCRFCNHALPAAYAMTRATPEGIQRSEYALGSPQAARLDDFEAPGFRLGAGTAMVWANGEKREGWPTILVSTVAACEALTEDVFRRASAVARERASRIATQQAVRGNARELATKNAARSAARTLAGSMERGIVGPAAPVPPIENKADGTTELF